MVVEWENLIDSSDMSPEGWAAMAKAVEDNYDDYDGFVILHGTDTMSYTSSALSFMFSNLAKSVIITGAAIPFFEPHSDARRNIVVSVLLAGSYNIPEVSLFSGTRLMRGTRCVKRITKSSGASDIHLPQIQTSAAGSFASPKFPDLATIDSCVQLSNILRLPPTGPFRADKRMEGSLLVLRMVPGFANLKSMALSDVKGVVLVLYGSGNAPSNQPHFTDWLIKVREQDIPVIGVSQILRGAINLGSYLGGVHLFSLGVISARDMTVEAAVAKLSYLLGKGYDRDKVAVEFGRSLRGEISQAGDADADGLQYLKLDL
ncbi:hypothetical protein FOZ61_003626 [Perkinsus olseni]|uniref:asparaginase n=1 Tax=Perkinsus olseni TaxID=32597 RepID=A0A7J6LNZ5_PEROL|nr:hypothetical protein FOZ61_003626 [Perkinsus olseni]KAF4667190.1 hypothetical protein FOL46_002652 [Perkinsus olseni]